MLWHTGGVTSPVSWFVEAFLQRSWLEFSFTDLLHDQYENEAFPQLLWKCEVQVSKHSKQLMNSYFSQQVGSVEDCWGGSFSR